MKIGKVEPGGMPNRRARYNVWPRLPPDEARKKLRAAVLVALADQAEPLTAVEVWRLVGRPGTQLLSDVLDDLARCQLIERRPWRWKPTGLPTHYFSLTAREG